MTTRIIDVGGGVGLETVEGGAGAATLLVAPGFGSGIRPYVPLIEHLADVHHVVGFSPRGFGRSDWASPYAINDWVEDLLGVVRSCARQPVVAVGHSFGAVLALAGAAVAPTRFRAVISLDQIVELEVFRPLAKQLNGYWQQIRVAVNEAGGDRGILAARLAEFLADEGQVDDMATRWSGQDPDVLESLTDDRSDEWLSDPVLDDLPGRVRCPLFCINGDPQAGSVVSEEQGVQNLVSYPGSDQVRLEGLDHGLGLDENPVPIAGAIQAFLADLS